MCSTTSVAFCNSEVAATLLSWLLVFAVCSVCAQPSVAKPSISTAVMINLCIHPPWRQSFDSYGVRYGLPRVCWRQPWSGLLGAASHLLSSEFCGPTSQFLLARMCSFAALGRAAGPPLHGQIRVASRAHKCPSHAYRLKERMNISRNLSREIYL